ncbi:hypothetical protein RSOLAG1IB_07187 [Rhizoctonia solani AG-1 IB]|uniref:Med15 domain-containing protein n=1 Tax=Thanatephorus cucumeris (strain AG1-IB / isolate 7/3/14) TaxID=1108050 RepID=A0A0B7FEJ6_THACB|nr:hypothetical protein RSOLAG1IB_07187 [Rhizoctonia solani AG-1 IB]
MAIVGDAEGELSRLWSLVCELSEQLNNNKAATASLQAQANALKGQAIHNGTGFALRRFNTDLSKEVFESELERMNAAIVIENQTLQHENKQLNILLKEYETTLETVMTKFRNQAHAAQQHELNLTRHYETMVLQLQAQTQAVVLGASTNHSQTVSRLSNLLRLLLRSFSGEDATFDPSALPDPRALCDPSHPDHAKAVEQLENLPSKETLVSDSNDTEETDARSDWALEREIEICRLEQENDTLRRLLAIHTGQPLPEGVSDTPSSSLIRPSSAASIDRPGSGMSVRAVDAWGDTSTPRYTRGMYDHLRPGRAPRGYIVSANPGGEGGATPGGGFGPGMQQGGGLGGMMGQPQQQQQQPQQQQQQQQQMGQGQGQGRSMMDPQPRLNMVMNW